MDKVHVALSKLHTSEIEAWVELLEENRDLKYPHAICDVVGQAARDDKGHEKRSYLSTELYNANMQFAFNVLKVATPFWVEGGDLVALIRHAYKDPNYYGAHDDEALYRYTKYRAFHAYVFYVSSDGRSLDADDLPADVVGDIDTYANRRRAISDQMIAFLKEYLAQRPADAA